MSALQSKDTIEVSSSSFLLSHLNLLLQTFLLRKNALKSDETQIQLELVL